jgi:hypothetical protein
MSKEGKYLNFVFTRYLYEKEEVEIALVLSLLYKKEDEALFWVFELFYSGFEQELWNLLWNIYIEFYASLNSGFETYLIKKFHEFKKSSCEKERVKIIGLTIQNFFIRPFNMDVFLLKQIHTNFELSSLSSFGENNNNLFEKLFKGMRGGVDWENLLPVVFHKNVNLENELCFLKDLLEYLNLDINKTKILNNYKKTFSFLSSSFPLIDKKTFLLSKILNIYGYSQKKKMGKNIYITCDDESEFIIYETIQKQPNLEAYKILKFARIFAVDDLNSLSLFRLKREKKDIREAFLNDWLYHASKSPIWFQRIHQYKGKVLEEDKKVCLSEEDEDEELFQSFYDHFGYEPDEQKKEVQDKSISLNIIKKTWLQVYKECGFLNSFLEIEEEYLEQLEKVVLF